MTRTRINHRTAAAILKSNEAARVGKKLAEQVAQNARDQHVMVGAFEGGGRIEIPVTVRMVTTDRVHFIVALAHPAGLAVQAKHGLLTKAAAAAGLEVRT